MDFNSYSEKLTKLRVVSRLSFLDDVLRALTPGERLVLYALTILLGASVLALLAGVNSAVSVTIPAAGGSLTEGEIGSARFINPILTLSQPDEDIAALVYSGLMRVLPDGTIIPDLASHFDISEDGTTYTFALRSDATFHDGKPVTADDILFTVHAAQNPDIKSVRRSDWEGVQASAPDAHTIVFKLPHSYAPFIENTTLGILPKHVWGNVSSKEFPFSPANTHPIGSGPYRVSSVDTDNTGSATRYELVPFVKYALGKPYLQNITFIFYPNQEEMLKAFDARKIDTVSGVTAGDLEALNRKDFNIVRVGLPRVFGVFFNQSHAPVLADASARAALDAAVDKRTIVRTVLQGYGELLEGPIPSGVLGENLPAEPTPFIHTTSMQNASTSTYADAARAILSRGGWKFDEKTGAWKKNKLEFSISLATADEPELVLTANSVAEYWRAAGIRVNVQVYALSELNNTVIRPRAYDAVLFGEVVGRTADLFAFWHSSQRNDPGLNLALYANSKVDTLLSQARATTDKQAREKLYAQFVSAIAKDDPAVFLYSPELIYVVPTKLAGVKLGALATPSERYLNVYDWYTDTDSVWSIFTDKIN
ncbi:MAG: ABC transporter substrate-binding protein [bacterium]|nr:ABC transporter substrate-binding protein [bacterium]